MENSPVAQIATRYIDAVGGGNLEPLDDLLSDELRARFAGDDFGKVEWVQALRRLLPALLRNDIRQVFVDGERACVIYDFVTDTPAGAVPCVEVLDVVDGRIVSIELILDRVQFAPVNQALNERATAT